MNYKYVFKRYEEKFLLSREKYVMLINALGEYLLPDEYPRGKINNIYYDTHDFLLIRRSIEKPVYKEKLRLRSYGGSGAFLEIKKKYNGIVYKRREEMDMLTALNYLNNDVCAPKESQIISEIDYFKNFYGGLYPSMFISYDREAFKLVSSYHDTRISDDIRITFDKNIIWRTEKLWGTNLLLNGEVLMEVKVPFAIPNWFCRILSDLEIYSSGFSKYGKAYQSFIENKNILGGIYA